MFKWKPKSIYKYLVVLTLLSGILMMYNDFIVTNIKIPTTMDFKETELRKTKLEDYTSNTRPKITVWTPYFSSRRTWKIIFKRLLQKECPFECDLKLTTNNWKSSDAILFHGADLPPFERGKNVHLPDQHHRPLWQVWIFFSLESPSLLKSQNAKLNLVELGYNWTMTYRLDSDVVVPYGKVISIEKPKDSESQPSSSTTQKNIWQELHYKKKSRFAIWFSGHCSTSSLRETYINELQKYVSVDIYGKCGNFKCGKRTILANPIIHWMTDPCNSILKFFYFYLAFENAVCKDYVTEKFYRALALGIVPVVMGGANYTQIAPMNSFIDVFSFSSVKELADYLVKVANNEELYMSYLSWKNHFTIDIGHPYSAMICEMCSKLHEHKFNISRRIETHSFYPSLVNWFGKKSDCGTWKQKLVETKANITKNATLVAG